MPDKPDVFPQTGKNSPLDISNKNDIKVIQDHRSLLSHSFAEFEQYISLLSQGYQADSPGSPERHISLFAAGLFSAGSIRFRFGNHDQRNARVPEFQ